VATNALRLISGGGSDNKFQIGCNVHQLSQFVNLKFPAKSCRGGGFSLTTGRLSRLALACATRNFLHLPIQVFALRAGSILLWERGVVGVVQAITVKQGKASGAADPRKEERARTE